MRANLKLLTLLGCVLLCRCSLTAEEVALWLGAKPLLSPEMFSTKQEEQSAPAPLPTPRKKWSIKGRGAFFFPQSDRMRAIYGNHYGEYSTEADYAFLDRYAAFLNVGFSHARGHSLGFRDSTTMMLIPMVAGMNFRFGHSNRWHPYLGAGVGTAYIYFKDSSPFVAKHTHAWGFASLAQGGIEWDLLSWMFLDLFGGYRWNWFHFHHVGGVQRQHTQTGGWQVGGGIGFRF